MRVERRGGEGDFGGRERRGGREGGELGGRGGVRRRGRKVKCETHEVSVCVLGVVHMIQNGAHIMSVSSEHTPRPAPKLRLQRRRTPEIPSLILIKLPPFLTIHRYFRGYGTF